MYDDPDKHGDRIMALEDTIIYLEQRLEQRLETVETQPVAIDKILKLHIPFA